MKLPRLLAAMAAAIAAAVLLSAPVANAADSEVPNKAPVQLEDTDPELHYAPQLEFTDLRTDGTPEAYVGNLDVVVDVGTDD